MEIIQERLEREFNMTVITTVPNVSYHAYTKKESRRNDSFKQSNRLARSFSIRSSRGAFIKASIITKSDFVGQVMSLCIEKRGEITNQTYLTTERVELTFDMPWQKLYSIFTID